MEKNDKNTKIMIYALAGIIFLAAVYFVVNKFVLTTGESEEAVTTMASGINDPLILNVNLDKIDSSIFEDERFKKLKYMEVKKLEISEIEVGNENPFSE